MSNTILNISILFDSFQLQHSKNYESDTEENFRMKIFMENRYKIARHNQAYEAGHVSYKLAMNRFGDLLHHEFLSTMTYKNVSHTTALK